MSRKKKSPDRSREPDSSKPSARAPDGWHDHSEQIRRKEFVVPGVVDEPARIVIAGDAYAELLSHAKASLEEEICGVLVGECCEDDQGAWVHALAAIRGTSAKQGGQHVTYTQETWEKIYEVKDRDYPKMIIVGWYHTHPGFGVEFSDMDLFIQQNFFSGPAQFALVLDPLSGDEAICVNGEQGIQNVGRFWVDGKPRRCWADPETSQEEGQATVTSVRVEQQLSTLEERVNQLIQTSEDERTRHSRFVTIVGMLVAFGAATWIFGNVVSMVLHPFPTPPTMSNWVPVPVTIEGKTVMLGVGIHKWDVPPDLNAALVELERQREAATKRPDQPTTRDEKKESSGVAPWISIVLVTAFVGICVLLIAVAIVPTVRGMRQRRGSRRQK